jgi:mannose-6-phosphate isomerase-like protein (cupin superfamily)
MKIDLKEFLEKLPLPSTTKWPEGVWDIEALKNGTMSLLLFTPRGKDYQTLHEQDELYIIFKGKGDLVIEGKVFSFTEGDVLFVPAGKQHKFVNFSKDLITWAIFWGPKGGEK